MCTTSPSHPRDQRDAGPNDCMVILIVGGGPAGLFVAENVSKAGFDTIVSDRMPSMGRKFLVAGRGGLNLTHSEAMEKFTTRYGTSPEQPVNNQNAPGSPQFWAELISEFSPTQLRDWAHGFGVETFVGTSGRVFPESKQAAPLLRRWLSRLRQQGVQFRTRHEFLDFAATEKEGRRGITARFKTPEGVTAITCDALVLAMGGASWPITGSNGEWCASLANKVHVQPLNPANCGYEFPWPTDFAEKFGGTPLKNVSVQVGDHRVLGELMITRHGWEGGALYQLGGELRRLKAEGKPLVLSIDLKPSFTVAELLTKLPGGSAWVTESREALIHRVHKPWRLSEVGGELLRMLSPDHLNPQKLAELAKDLRFNLTGPRPIEEAISSSGGILWSELTAQLQLKAHPGLFCAGEMVDWDAPTGGYLIQGCFATAYRAASGIFRFLSQS